MGSTRTDLYSEELIELAAFIKILGHPARLAILQKISESDACICTDLSEEIGLSQATISQHLQKLRSIDLISGVISGPKLCYCLNHKSWIKYKSQLGHFFNGLNACC